jgi:hypothetical protein
MHAAAVKSADKLRQSLLKSNPISPAVTCYETVVKYFPEIIENIALRLDSVSSAYIASHR